MEKHYIYPEHHIKMFGNKNPVSADIILEKIFGIPPLETSSQIGEWGKLEVTERKDPTKYIFQINPNDICPRQIIPKEEAEKWKSGNLYKSIKKEGIRNPLLIEERENGNYQYIVYEGGHRLECAKIAGLDTVPAVVLRPSLSSSTKRKWLKEQISLLEKEWKWYQKIELEEGITTPGYANDKKSWDQLRTILPNTLEKCTVADLGCNAGLYCIYLAFEGADVTGIDCDSRWIAQANFLKEYFIKKYTVGLSIHYVNESIENLSTETVGKFDVIIAPSVLYHIRDSMSHIAKILASLSPCVIARFQQWEDGHNGEVFTKEMEALGFRVAVKSDLIGRRFWIKYILGEV